MPTYRYECRSCGEFHEEFQSMNDKPLRKCPKCGGRLDRLIGTGSGILLKGSGFHNTDYRSSSYKADSKSDSASKSDSGSAAPASSEKSSSTGDSAAPKSEPKKESPKPPASEKKGKKK